MHSQGTPADMARSLHPIRDADHNVVDSQTNKFPHVMEVVLVDDKGAALDDKYQDSRPASSRLSFTQDFPAIAWVRNLHQKERV